MPGYRLRPVAGKDRNPARGRFRQGAGQPGEPLQRDWLGSRHGPAYAVVGRGRTELDAAPCPDREEPVMRASVGNRYGEPRGRAYARSAGSGVLPGPRR